jgi:hypothetical protein
MYQKEATMNRLSTFALLTSALLLGFGLLAGDALAQQKLLKEQLVGTWKVVTSDNVTPEGAKRQTFGTNPKGVLILDASGQYAQIIVRTDRPKFKVNNRLEGTAEENKAAVQGTTASFGTWSVDEASKSLIRRIEGSLFANQEGADQKTTIISLTADELKISNPTPGAGGITENVFKRAK